MLFGITIVCDRFVYDTLIDLAVATKNPDIYTKPVGKLFLIMIPRNAKFIMLTLDKKTIVSRRPELKDDITFDERYELYGRLADRFGITTIENVDLCKNVSSSVKKMLVV